MRARRPVRPVPALAAILLAAALALTGCSGSNSDSGGSSAADKATHTSTVASVARAIPPLKRGHMSSVKRSVAACEGLACVAIHTSVLNVPFAAPSPRPPRLRQRCEHQSVRL